VTRVRLAHAVAHNIPRVGMKHAIANENAHIRTIQVGSHDTHTLAITPIQIACVKVGGHSHRRYSGPWPTNSRRLPPLRSMRSSEPSAWKKLTFSRTNRRPHVCPAQGLCLFVDDDAVDIAEQIPDPRPRLPPSVSVSMISPPGRYCRM
jgi:hypothetical protein